MVQNAIVSQVRRQPPNRSVSISGENNNISSTQTINTAQQTSNTNASVNQASFNTTTKQIQERKNKPFINPTIKNKLDELNIKPTGSNKGDLAAIQNAMAHNPVFNSIQNPNFILWLDKIK
ncbi:MAG: hypothetical protein AB7V50_07735 [Vampirovibrionia bacterium]